MSDLEAQVRLALLICLSLLLAVLLLQLVLPWLLVGAISGALYWLWRRVDRARRQRQTVLNQVFYTVLQAQQGRVSVLDFAMQAQLSGTEAQAYLDEQARAFSARFEPTLQGDILYVFSLGTCSAMAADNELIS